MSSVSKSSSFPTTPRRGLFSKMFQKSVPTQTHPYPHPSTSARDSGNILETAVVSSPLTPNTESTLVSPTRSSPKKDEQHDPNASFGALASTYGWGGAHIPALPSASATTGKSKKKKPSAAQKSAASAAQAPSAPHQPLRQPLTQAQREQAIVDLSSRYMTLPGGRGRM